jgi:protease II
VLENGYYYYERRKTKQYYKYCIERKDLSACEEVLMDVDKMAKVTLLFCFQLV